MELGIVVCLTIMGIYFYKSADLPKDMKARSAQTRAEIGPADLSKPKRMSQLKVITKNASADINLDKLAELNLGKKAAELKFHNEAIDKLTLTITTLEQEIRLNNDRNSEIQKQIDSHLISLQLLQEKVNSLS